MGLVIQSFNCGPIDNNVILLLDEETRKAILFDPSFDPETVLNFIQKRKLKVDAILFTHGHFDHFAGLNYLLATLNPVPKIGLHPGDLKIWREGGGSVQFRFPIALPAEPDLQLEHLQIIKLGEHEIEVRHTPGHSPGSVIFSIPSINTAIAGDLIFKQGIGRTDLEGGNSRLLIHSIESQVFTLPPQTILVPGHGSSTTVADEKEFNPYVGIRSNFL